MDGDELGSQDMDYENDGFYDFSFSIPDNSSAQKDSVLTFQIFWTQDMGPYEWTIYTDGTTYIDYPIALDTDDDNTPDFMDEDDDNDGFSDEDENIAGTNPVDPNDIPKTNDDDGFIPGFESSLLIVALVSGTIIIKRFH